MRSGDSAPASASKTRLIDWLVLAVIASAAFGLRVYFSWGRVLTAEYVNFQGSDSWYHLRLIENLVHNFPYGLTVDPYALAGGQRIAVGPFFSLVVAGVAWLVGFGAPSDRQVEFAAAILPPILAAAATLPVYAIGSRLFDRRAGLLAAALLAVMPGQLLDRSVFGYVDHHAMEVLLMSAAVLCAILDVSGGAGSARRSLRLGLLAGLALGCYLLTWTSGAFMVFILALWAAVQFLLEYLRARPAKSNAPFMATKAAVGLILVLVFQDHEMFRFASQVASLVVLLGLTIVLAGVRRFRPPSSRTRYLVPLGLSALGLASAFLAAWLIPSVSGVILEDVRRLGPGIAGRTVTEAQPLFYLVGGRFSFAPGWVLFRTGFFLGVAALIPLGLRVWRDARPGESLLLIWSLVMLAATVGQNRFGYYLMVNLALLSGWMCSQALAWAASRPEPQPRRGRKRSSPSRFESLRRLRTPVIATAVAALVFLPSLLQARRVVEVDTGVPAAWHSALDWLRANSPEPFSAGDQYLARESRASNTPAYTVMNWWDSGYRVVQIARRVPVSNPTQAGADVAARFFTATSEREANALMDQQRSRYALVDDDLPILLRDAATRVTGTFGSILAWSGIPQERFFEVYYESQQPGQVSSVMLFYPDYYRTMAYRLYLHAGQAVTPSNATYVITYADRRFPDGTPFRLIVASRRFETFEEGQAHVESLGPGPHRMAARDPMRTPVPLEAVRSYRLVHDSYGPATADNLPVVRIFEYSQKAGTPP